MPKKPGAAVTPIGNARLKNITTAEGVETAEQFEIVKDYGCTFAQGFLFHRPQPAETIREISSVQQDIQQNAA